MANKNKNVVFISGNTHLDEKRFITYYIPTLKVLVEQDDCLFNISDDDGVSAMCQAVFNSALKDKTRVNVFGCKTKPKNYANSDFFYIGGFKTTEERDAALSATSNLDLHLVFNGKGVTLVKNNIIRRNTTEFD